MAIFGRRPSFEARLSGLVALAVGVTIALAALASYLLVAQELHAQAQHELATQQRSINQSFTIPAQQAAIRYASKAGERVQVVAGNGPIYVPDAMGGFSLAGPGTTTFAPTAAELAMAKGGGPAVRYTDQTVGATPYRVMAMKVEIPIFARPPIPAVLLIGRPLSDVYRALADLRLILAFVTAGGIALALAIGTAIARATIRPVEHLRAAAEHVAATQSLDATIEQRGDDELARLAHAFNAMLEALRLSRQQQAQLVSDAGHELRTPLTSLRTNVELLMRAGDLPQQDRSALLGDVRDQLEELTALIGDIVETAREDEQAQTEPTEARLDTIVGRAVERARRRAPSLSFDASLTAGSVRAHPVMLERAVLNVLDNAAKWSPPGGRVEVRLVRNGAWILDIRDHGPGIEPQDLPRIFDRFYRAASARSMPGSGLGLAIVRDVVTGHGGAVQIIPPPDGGTLVRIMLPTVEEEEPSPPIGSWEQRAPAQGVPAQGVPAPMAPPPPPS
ncbi:MAG: HAMP domain-containing sensor histidine kinase [Actinomycetota bacterium]|nr:HAMP domain-containing sensor histidine kinase [Actinomycetota bacterium]